MRNVLYIGFMLSIIGICSTFSFGQCIPNNDTIPGITPDTLAPAYVGVLYEEVIYFRVPLDTTVLFGPIPVALLVDSLVIDSVKGLPSTFSYACSSVDCNFPGGTNGCTSITGTADLSDAGIHPLKVFITTYVSDTLGTPIGGFPDSIETYFLDVQISSGIEQLPGSELVLGKCFPDPASSIIYFMISSPIDSDIEVAVIDLTGKKLLHRIVPAKSGGNTETIDVSLFQNGSYILKIQRGDSVRQAKFHVLHQ